MKRILIVSFIVFVTVQSTAIAQEHNKNKNTPPLSLIKILTNKCITDYFMPEDLVEFKNGSFKIGLIADTINPKSTGYRIDQVERLNGVEYKGQYFWSYMYKNEGGEFSGVPYDKNAMLYVSVKNGVLITSVTESTSLAGRCQFKVDMNDNNHEIFDYSRNIQEAECKRKVTENRLKCEEEFQHEFRNTSTFIHH